MSLRAHERAPGAAAAEHGRVAAGTGSRVLAETVLALQRSAGNHAVSQALRARPSSGRMLARLGLPEVKRIMKDSRATNVDEVNPEVIATIAEVATAWELESDDRTARYESVSGILEEFVSRFSGSGLPHPKDADWWRTWLRTVIVALEDKQRGRRWSVPQLPKPVASAPAGALDVPAGLIVGLEKRIVIHCQMGQGVVANLGRYTLYSDKFWTCSPVVMFNEDSRLGGLFHYASQGTGQHAELAAMYHRIKPTWIGVNRRARNATEGRATQEEFDDYESLMRFFLHRLQVEPAAEVEIIPGFSSSCAAYLDGPTDTKPTVKKTLPHKPSAARPAVDVTRQKSSRELDKEVLLLVNEEHYGAETFATTSATSY